MAEEEEKEEESVLENVNKKANEEFHRGVGLDIGTMNLISSRKKKSGEVVNKRMRDCFLDFDSDAQKMLSMSDVSYIEYDDSLIILGDPAMNMAKTFNRELRRPLSGGLISPGEVDAEEVLSILIENVIGDPQEEDEVCYFSVPANPVDKPDQNIVYHKSVFTKVLEELGYDARPANEAMAIIYSNCADSMFSGIGISFGSGMVNCALSYKTMNALEFSLAKGGDWIDKNSAVQTGSTASKMCSIKEKGLDLRDPSKGDEQQERQREALTAYYKELIRYALKNIEKEFKKVQDDVELPEAIPLVVSGGTSMATGFVKLFEEVFEKKRKKFPIEVSEIRHADDPMNAVAQGLMVQAMQEYPND